MITDIVFDSDKEIIFGRPPQDNPQLITAYDDETGAVKLETSVDDCRRLWYSVVCILSAWTVIRAANRFDDMWIIGRRLPSLWGRLWGEKAVEVFRFQPSHWGGFIMEYITENGYD